MNYYNFEESLSRIDKSIEKEKNEKIEISIPSKEEINIGNPIIANACIVSININTSKEEYIPIFVGESIEICKDLNNFFNYRFNGSNLLLIFNTPFKVDLRVVIDFLGKIRSLSQIIQSKIYKKFNSFNDSFKVNIGMGFYPITISKIRENNDIIFYGEKIDDVKELSSKAKDNLRIDYTIWQNLDDEYRGYFRKCEDNDKEYQCGIINIMMNNWLTG